VIDSGDEVLGAAKSEGAMADRFDLVIHTFDGRAVHRVQLTIAATVEERQHTFQKGYLNP